MGMRNGLKKRVKNEKEKRTQYVLTLVARMISSRRLLVWFESYRERVILQVSGSTLRMATHHDDKDNESDEEESNDWPAPTLLSPARSETSCDVSAELPRMTTTASKSPIP